jgi:hypothetical protein
MNELETLEQYALDHYEDGGIGSMRLSQLPTTPNSGRGRLPPSG